MTPFQVTMPAISLRHLTVATRNWLLQTKNFIKEQPFLIADYEEGFFIRIPACEACADSEQKAEFRRFPVDLQGVFNALQPLAPYGWIMLDVDGDIMPGLSLYKDPT